MCVNNIKAIFFFNYIKKMPYKNAKLYRKTRKPLRGRKSPNTYKRIVRVPRRLAAAVRKEVQRTAEKKQYTAGFVNQNIDQRLDTGNQQRFLFQPTIGSAVDQRIGNRVRVSGVRCTGVFTIMQNMDYPHMVKMVLYKLKTGTAIPSQGQLDRMVNLGSSATHLGETLINILRPLNKDLFTFHKVKMVKMAKAQHGTGTSNNDYLFTYYVKWWIPINKTVIFDDNDTNVPTNWSMFFGAAAVRSDGEVADPQSAVVNYDMDYTFFYTDL